jgi:hypothetical protein
MTAPLPPHGTRARYNHRTAGCRCAPCRDANNRYMTVYRAGGVPHRPNWRQLTLGDALEDGR